MDKDLTVKQLAEKFGVTSMTIYRYIKQGKLKSYKHCGRTYITLNAVQEFIMKENTRGN